MESILYISYDGMTDNLGQAQVIPYLLGLQKKGYKIHILSCEKPHIFDERKNVISELLEQNSISWHPISYTASPPVVSTIRDIKRLQIEASKIITKHNINLLHCRSYISAGIGLYAQKKFGLPWIFDMRGFWADERVEGGIWNLSNPLFKKVYNHFKKKEQLYVSKADHIISLTHAGKTEIERWPAHLESKTPITVIPCCADLDYFSYDSISESTKIDLKAELQISQDSFVLSYLGSFGTWYMTDEMFDFFAELHKIKPNSVFMCITPDNKTWLEDIAESKGIPKEALRVFKANREDVAKYASLSDWSLFFIKPVYSKTASSPTKMGELLGLGIPLICNSNVGDVSSIMQNCTPGELVSEFNSKTYIEVIQRVIATKEVSKEKLRDVACNVYSLEMGVEKYNSVYKSLLK